MTVALFVEAVDTIRALGWALAVWIVLLAAVASLAVWTLVVTVAFASRAVWRGVAAALAAVQRPSAPEVLPERRNPPEARLCPSWVQPDKDTACTTR